MKIKLISLLAGVVFLSINAFAQWTTQRSGTTARFRGVSAVNDKVAWASGANGTYARTTDGGATWQAATVPGAEQLDFRDVEAFDANTAYLLSIGEGDKSRIYKTTDGGKRWTLQFKNEQPKAFFDAIAFFDRNNGLAMSDPVDGRFVIIRTTDGGATWRQVTPANLPAALPGEGAFAASGTCLVVERKRNAWFATGGAERARVFRSTDGGEHWQVADTPIRTGNAASGIFSIVFRDARHGAAIGGDYQKADVAIENIALTNDGGRTWELVRDSGLSGFRSAIVWATGIEKNLLVAVGPSGSDFSTDGGEHWKPLDSGGYHAFSLSANKKRGWAVGEDGRIARFDGIQKNTNTNQPSKKIRTVNFYNLFIDPSQYDQQTIRVRAIYRYGGEDTVGLYHPDCVGKGGVRPFFTDEAFSRTKPALLRKFSLQQHDSGTVGSVFVGEISYISEQTMGLAVKFVEQATYLSRKSDLPDSLPANVLRKVRRYVRAEKKR